jgi:hypothetical protein
MAREISAGHPSRKAPPARHGVSARSPLSMPLDRLKMTAASGTDLYAFNHKQQKSTMWLSQKLKPFSGQWNRPIAACSFRQGAGGDDSRGSLVKGKGCHYE